MRKFAVFDIDGTLIRWQLYHVIVLKLAKAGVLGENTRSLLKDAMMSWKNREDSKAFKRYEKVLIARYEDVIKNISPKLFDKLVDEVIEEYKNQTYVYTRNLLTRLKKEGYKLFIISGSHIELIEKIGKHYGFDDWIGTKYERSAQGFTGNVTISTLDKDKSLKILMNRHAVSLDGSIGIGDTKGDIPILKIVELPIAFNPDKRLFNEAVKRGWKIIIERKDVIYELDKNNGKYQLSTRD